MPVLSPIDFISPPIMGLSAWDRIPGLGLQIVTDINETTYLVR